MFDQATADDSGDLTRGVGLKILDTGTFWANWCGFGFDESAV